MNFLHHTSGFLFFQLQFQLNEVQMIVEREVQPVLSQISYLESCFVAFKEMAEPAMHF
jgi:hypothetical protein